MSSVEKFGFYGEFYKVGDCVSRDSLIELGGGALDFLRGEGVDEEIIALLDDGGEYVATKRDWFRAVGDEVQSLFKNVPDSVEFVGVERVSRFQVYRVESIVFKLMVLGGYAIASVPFVLSLSFLAYLCTSYVAGLVSGGLIGSQESVNGSIDFLVEVFPFMQSFLENGTVTNVSLLVVLLGVFGGWLLSVFNYDLYIPSLRSQDYRKIDDAVFDLGSGDLVVHPKQLLDFRRVDGDSIDSDCNENLLKLYEHYDYDWVFVSEWFEKAEEFLGHFTYGNCDVVGDSESGVESELYLMRTPLVSILPYTVEGLNELVWGHRGCAHYSGYGEEEFVSVYGVNPKGSVSGALDQVYSSSVVDGVVESGLRDSRVELAWSKIDRVKTDYGSKLLDVVYVIENNALFNVKFAPTEKFLTEYYKYDSSVLEGLGLVELEEYATRLELFYESAVYESERLGYEALGVDAPKGRKAAGLARVAMGEANDAESRLAWEAFDRVAKTLNVIFPSVTRAEIESRSYRSITSR